MEREGRVMHNLYTILCNVDEDIRMGIISRAPVNWF